MNEKSYPIATLKNLFLCTRKKPFLRSATSLLMTTLGKALLSLQQKHPEKKSQRRFIKENLWVRKGHCLPFRRFISSFLVTKQGTKKYIQYHKPSISESDFYYFQAKDILCREKKKKKEGFNSLIYLLQQQGHPENKK